MAEIINLRRARKQRQREDAQATAEQNRLTFGRSKAERNLTQTLNDKAAHDLDGHRLPGAFSSEVDSGSHEENATNDKRAFSSEMDSGSRQENAIEQEVRAAFRFKLIGTRSSESGRDGEEP